MIMIQHKDLTLLITNIVLTMIIIVIISIVLLLESIRCVAETFHPTRHNQTPEFSCILSEMLKTETILNHFEYFVEPVSKSQAACCQRHCLQTTGANLIIIH